MQATTKNSGYDDGHSAMLMLSMVMLLSAFVAGLIVGVAVF